VFCTFKNHLDSVSFLSHCREFWERKCKIFYFSRSTAIKMLFFFLEAWKNQIARRVKMGTNALLLECVNLKIDEKN
jgi:hypothetical protein